MSDGTEFTSPVPVDFHRPRRLVLLLVFAASTAYLCRVDVAVVAPRLMEEFHFSQVHMGKIFSAFLIAYTAFQIPSGWIADRLSTRTLFPLLALGWAIVTVAAALVGRVRLGFALAPLSALLVLRAAFGVIASPTYPAAGRFIAVSIPAWLRGRANGAILASIGIGSAVTPPLLGSVSARWGWRPAMIVAAAIALSTAVLWWLAAPDPGESRVRTANAFREQTPESEGILPNWSTPLRQRDFWFLAASYTLDGYVGYVFVFWIYIYLVQVRHFGLLKAAWLTSLPWICTILAIPLGGILSDWAAKRWGETWGRRGVPIPALLLAAGLLALGAITASAAAAVVSLTLCTALVLSTEAPFWATMNRICGPRSGVGGGVLNFGGNLGGAISPFATPWLAERFGWGIALSFASLLAVVSALLWLGVDFGRPSGKTPVADHKSANLIVGE